MEAIADMSWLGQVSLFAVERWKLRGFDLALLSLPPTPRYHDERYRFRLLAFDPYLGKPVVSVDMESDILGEHCLAVQEGREHRVVARFDELPTLEEFRGRALAELEPLLPPSPSPLPSAPRPARKRRGA